MLADKYKRDVHYAGAVKLMGPQAWARVMCLATEAKRDVRHIVELAVNMLWLSTRQTPSGRALRAAQKTKLTTRAVEDAALRAKLNERNRKERNDAE